MICVALPRWTNQQNLMMMRGAGIGASFATVPTPVNSLGNRCRYDLDGRGGFKSDYGKTMFDCMGAARTRNDAVKRMHFGISAMASGVADPPSVARANIYKKVFEDARDKFTREISFQAKDKDISLAKALLYVAVEDEAFLAYNCEMDIQSMHNERKDMLPLPDIREWNGVEDMPIGGRNLSEWLAELDIIAKEVEAELVSREIGCHLVEVVEAVNKVLFEFRGFKRFPVLVDSKCSYLHSALSSGCASDLI